VTAEATAISRWGGVNERIHNLESCRSYQLVVSVTTSPERRRMMTSSDSAIM
jgi:hypothetical protein